MKKSLGVFGFGQFMEFFTPHLIPTFDVLVYDKKGKGEQILNVGANVGTFEEVAQCKYVLLGYPASHTAELAKEIAPLLKPEAVVFDICSVKIPATEAMTQFLPPYVHLIGTHPVFGPQSGKNGITGLKLVLSKIRASDEVYENFKTIFGKDLGLQVLEITPEEHDREMAYIQGITHFIGRALKNIAIPDAPLSTKSYDHLRETSEIVGYDTEDLFLSIERDNPYSGEVIKKLMKELDRLARLIEGKN